MVSNYIHRALKVIVKGVPAALLLASSVAFTPVDISALDVSHYALSSQLAQGKWVKIKVADSGMHLVTNAQLKTMGFSDPSKVNVYGYGGRVISENLTADQVDDLPQLPAVHTDAGIVFYGVGTVAVNFSASGEYTHSQNPYATESCYFLSDRQADTYTQPVAVLPQGAAVRTVTSFPACLIHEKELEAAGNTGRMLLGEDFRSKTSQTFMFDLPGRVEGDIDMTIQLAAKSAKGTNKFSLTANGVALEDCTLAGLTSGYTETYMRLAAFPYTIPDDGADKLELRIDYSNSGASVIYMSRLDYIRLVYQRSLALSSGSLNFSFVGSEGGPTELQISGCNSTTQVWDVTNPANPAKVEATLSGTTLKFNAVAGARQYVAFTPAEVTDGVSNLGSVSNQDIHAMATPDLVIISPSAFLTQARRLAQLHSDQDNMDVVILTPEEVYNEFSSGTADVSAFRKLLKMWYDREPDKIGYCILFGRPSYDNRGITSTVQSSSYPRIPIWESENSLGETSSYCTDNFIGMLDDCDKFSIGPAKVRVSIGRMPVKSTSEATIAIDKLEQYTSASSLGSWRNQVMVIADDADYGVHLTQAQTVINALRSRGNGKNFLYERLYLDSYPLGTASTSKSYPEARERMLKLWNDGVGYIDFIGHGNPTALTHENLLTYSDVNTMTNKYLPIMLAATCEFMRFDSNSISAAELLWLNPNGGTIAFIAANRKVYISNNGVLNEAISKNMYARTAEGKAKRLGDVFRQGLNDYPSSDDNRHRYALMGDPAMKIASPELSIAIDSLAGYDISSIASAADYPVIPARSKVVVKGRITDADGNQLTDFNGKIVPTLYDAERVIQTYGHPATGEDDGKVMMYNDRKNRLFTGTFQVTNGTWEATLLLPMEIDNNYSPALLNLYAYTDDGREANGATEKFYVYGFTDDDDPDTIDPEISAMGLNTLNFKSGSTVNPSPTFVARVSDESGINISTSGIGKQMTLIIDGRNIYEDLVNYYTPDINDYTAGNVAYPLSDLSDGDHTLQFTVWDNAGNSTTRYLDFKVSEKVQPTVNIYTDANPATSGVTFYITPDIPSSKMSTILEIYDIAGRMIWSAETSGTGDYGEAMQVKWDLLDRGGVRVARGIYVCRCVVISSDGTETVATKKIAVSAQ